ncbi:mannose-6-phosphate isomerase, class I [Chloroflexota bacterium]
MNRFQAAELNNMASTEMTFAPRPYLLVNKIQHYVWGTRGKDAFIPRFLGLEAEPGRPYAELWIGAHIKAPSDVVLDGSAVSLRQLLSQYPLEILGEGVARRFSGSLPFLFKVLSAAEALSIQVHPSKEQARVLHARDPEHYPDDNHKPELVIALDSLMALIGFKSFSGILQTLENYPELADLIGEDVCHELRDLRNPSPLEQREYVRRIYSTLVSRSLSHPEGLAEASSRLSERLGAATGGLSEEERLFLALERQYPASDVGLFSLFLLNLVHLKKGQGMFIKAGIPHAYLKGNVVECMANSDNVVRVGLTPKFKDAGTLVKILDYEPRAVSALEGVPDSERIIYRTSASEFQVSLWKLASGMERREATEGKPIVFLISKGNVLFIWDVGLESGEQVFHQGQSVLIPACLKEFRLRAQSAVELFEVEVP